MYYFVSRRKRHTGYRGGHNVRGGAGRIHPGKKVTREEKDLFSAICSKLGTSPSNAMRMFVSAFNRNGGFPFDIANPYGFSRDTLDAMADSAAGRVIGPFDTNEAMWRSIFEDGE